MNLRNKLISALFVFTVLFVTSIYLLSSSIILNGFSNIEDEINQKTIERFKKVIEDELSTLTITSVGWSSWDDSYAYATAKVRNDHYVKNNFEIETMFDSKFTRVSFFDLNLNTLFAKEYLHAERKILNTDSKILNEFHEKVLINATRVDLKTPMAGIFVHDKQAEFFTLNPVYPGSGKGHPVGYMGFFRAIDQERLEKLSSIMNFTIHLNIIPKVLKNSNQIQLINNQENTLAKINLDSFDKKMEIHFDFKIPRSIYNYGTNVNTKFLVVLLLVTVLLCFLVYRFFDKYIIKKILIINNELLEISSSKFEKSSVSAFSDDEIGQLSKSINLSLETISNNNVIINRASKFSALGEIAASLAHEINNPITAISLQASSITKLLEEPVSLDKNEIKDKIEKIKNQTLRIEKIIKSLRFISRDGDLDPFELITLEKLFEEIHALFIETLKHKNIQFDTKSFNVTFSIRCRPVQIVQILINLINNAIDAIENSESPWIKLSSYEDDRNVYICLTDSGIIHDDAVIKKMMEPFFTTKSSGKGTGLGLSITKKIMESHQGSIHFESTPHTSFVLAFSKLKLS